MSAAAGQPELLQRVDDAITADAVKPRAKALLLLKLAQLSAVLAPEKAPGYFQQLKPIKHLIPPDVQSAFDDLRQQFDVEPAPTSGFAGECISRIQTVLGDEHASADDRKEVLRSCEAMLRKRWWPFGKSAVWRALFNAWADIDRSQAWTLAGEIQRQTLVSLVRRLHHGRPLESAEWTVLSTALGSVPTDVVLELLEDSKPNLDLPDQFIEPVVVAIMNRLAAASDPREKLGDALDTLDTFIALMNSDARRAVIRGALTHALNVITVANPPDLDWVRRFDGLRRILNLAIRTGALGEGDAENFLAVRKSMLEFTRAHVAAMRATAESAGANLADMLGRVQNTADAEVWYLVVLVYRGMGETALGLAKASKGSQDLVQRIRRAWLCLDPEGAARNIVPQDMPDDPISQILIRPVGPERVSYLRAITSNGTQDLPGAVWVTRAPEEEKKTGWAAMFSSGKTPEQMTNEYIERNPLYAVYNVVMPEGEQFHTYVTLNGHLHYEHATVDEMLLNTFVHWADEQPAEVRALARRMWEAIRPEEALLKLDCLRNAVFTRCITALAVAPDVLTEEFVTWLRLTLIESSLSWQVGNTTYRIQYPATTQASMCVRAALAVQSLSAKRRDGLLEIALTRYPADDGLAELAARAYSSNKEPFDLKVPWKTESDVTEAWQVGIVRRTIPAIFEAMMAAANAAAAQRKESEAGEGVRASS